MNRRPHESWGTYLAYVTYSRGCRFAHTNAVEGKANYHIPAERIWYSGYARPFRESNDIKGVVYKTTK